MVGGLKEVHQTETYDGKDLTQNQFDWLHSFISKYSNKKMNLDIVKRDYPLTKPIAIAGIIYNLSMRGYLNNFEESNGKFIQAHQKAVETIPKVEYTPRRMHVEYEQPAKPKPQVVQAEMDVVKFAEQGMENYNVNAIKNIKEEVDSAVEMRQIQEDIPKPSNQTFKNLPQEIFDEEKVNVVIKKMVEKEISPLYDKMGSLASQFSTLNKSIAEISMGLNTKKRQPEEVLAGFEGGIREILTQLKSIESPETDNALPERLKGYKEARMDGNSYNEREYAWNVVNRQELMIGWYFQLVIQMGKMISYLKAVKGIHVSVDEGSPTDEIMDQGGNNE